MDYKPDKKLFSISLEIARQVLPFMGQHSIPATPENYMIFYLYFEGSRPLVNETVNDFLNSDQPWSEETTNRVFEQLFSPRANLRLMRLNEEIVRQVRETTRVIIEETKAAAKLAHRTSQRMDTSLKEADRMNVDAAISQWLASTLKDVRLINEANRNLGGSLRSKGEDLEAVTATLAKMETMALTDELTQLANRRAWDQRLASEFERYMLNGAPCSLLIVDVDDFKNINDSHGHLVGDQALKEVARLMVNCLRPSDFSARFGGDEFVFLLPGTDLKEAYKLAEQARKVIQSANFAVRGTKHPLTASIGVASFHTSDPKADAALERADKAMYLAKSRGKNIICAEDDPDMAQL
jgi:diguanylate cyclase